MEPGQDYNYDDGGAIPEMNSVTDAVNANMNEISCTSCTFLNPSTAMKCEMCESNL